MFCLCASYIKISVRYEKGGHEESIDRRYIILLFVFVFFVVSLVWSWSFKFCWLPFNKSFGAPQFGHVAAFSEYSFPHSGHLISAIFLSSSYDILFVDRRSDITVCNILSNPALAVVFCRVGSTLHRVSLYASVEIYITLC